MPDTHAALPESFIAVEGEDEAAARELIVRYMGLKALDKGAVYLDHVFPWIEKLPADIRDAAMLEMLRNYPALSSIRVALHRNAAALAFVPCQASGRRLRRACDLCDPEASELTHLIDAEDIPASTFTTPDVLPALRTLGLRDRLNADAAAKV